MRRIIFCLFLISAPISAQACIDCTGTGSSVIFTGTVTAQTFVGPTISTITERLTALESSIVGVSPKSIYTLVVGTPGTPSVNAYVSNTSQFNLLLASIGALGLMDASTAPAQILFRDGSYVMTGATVPRGVELIGGSSTVWVDGGTAQTQLVKNYGTIRNFKFNLNGLTYVAPKIQLSSFSVLDACDIYGALNGGALTQSNALYITNAVGVRARKIRLLDAKINNAAGANYGMAGPVFVKSSSDCVLQFDLIEAGNGVNTGDSALMGVTQSTGIIIENSYIRNLTTNGIMFYSGVVNSGVRNSEFYLTANAGDSGVIVFSKNDVSPQLGVSTGCFVIGNRFFTSGVSSGKVISLEMTIDRGRASSVRIINNTAISQGSSAMTFVTIGTGGSQTELVGNSSSGLATLLTDSGVGTVKVANYKDGILQ